MDLTCGSCHAFRPLGSGLVSFGNQNIFKYGSDNCLKLLLTMLKSHIILRAVNELHSHLLRGSLSHLGRTVVMAPTFEASLMSGNSQSFLFWKGRPSLDLCPFCYISEICMDEIAGKSLFLCQG